MNHNPMQDFVSKYAMAALVIGIIAFLGGIALAYFTNDADPWGTIGGVICALGLMLVVFAGSTRNKD